MKRILFSISCMIVACTAHAQSYDYLTFESTSGSKAMKSVGTVITFADGKLIAQNDGKELVLTMADLRKLYFSGEPTPVEAVSSDVDEPVAVYSLSGQLLGRFLNAASAAAELSKGIYMVKGNRESKKMMVK